VGRGEEWGWLAHMWGSTRALGPLRLPPARPACRRTATCSLAQQHCAATPAAVGLPLARPVPPRCRPLACLTPVRPPLAAALPPRSFCAAALHLARLPNAPSPAPRCRRLARSPALCRCTSTCSPAPRRRAAARPAAALPPPRWRPAATPPALCRRTAPRSPASRRRPSASHIIPHPPPPRPQRQRVAQHLAQPLQRLLVPHRGHHHGAGPPALVHGAARRLD
jgi:hypothetical protein